MTKRKEDSAVVTESQASTGKLDKEKRRLGSHYHKARQVQGNWTKRKEDSAAVIRKPDVAGKLDKEKD